MNAETNFSALDRQFGDFLQRLAGASAPEVRLAAMCASRARAEGNICVTLAGNRRAGRRAERCERCEKNCAAAASSVRPVSSHRSFSIRTTGFISVAIGNTKQQLAHAILSRTVSSARVAQGETDLQQIAATKAVCEPFHCHHRRARYR